MEERSKRLSPEALLAHAGWLRQLAASLVADPGMADDVVQETWLAALVHPPAVDRPIEPWLARVARNFAFQRRRGEQRRATHELAAGPAPAALTPAQTVERLALQRAVVEAVLAIEEPFRTTIVQRYFEGHSSAEIARLYGVPPGTVRWRLKRGLAELRVRLDSRFGTREGWCALLAPIVGTATLTRPPAGAGRGAVPRFSTTLATLVTTHGTALGAALLVAAGLTWWSLERRSNASTRSLADAPLEAFAPRTRASASTGTLVPARGDAREELVLGASGARSSPPSTTAAVPAPARTAALDARFVDALGAPLEGVNLALQGDPGPLVVREPAAPSLADGRARLELQFPEPGACALAEVDALGLALVARRAGSTTVVRNSVVRVGETTHLGDVVLGPGVRLSGRVLDEAGRGFAHATIGTTVAALPAEEEGRLRRHGARAFGPPTTESADDGTFVLDGVGAGTWRLWGHAVGTRFAWSEPIVVSAERDVEAPELVLTPLLATDRIEGRIVGPDGEPEHAALLCDLRDARLGGLSSTTPVDEQGRFSILCEHDSDLWELTAVDMDGALSATHVTGVRPGTLALVLRMEATRLQELHVAAPDGRAVEGATILVGVSDFWSPAGVEAFAPGRYRVPIPAGAFELELSAPGFHSAQLGPFEPTALSGPLELVLVPAPLVRGRVTAAGRAVAGARVELRADDPLGLGTVNGFRCVMAAQSDRRATTDAEGRFELSDDLDGLFWIRAVASGFAPAELGPFDRAQLAAAAELELPLTAGGALEGRVLPPAGGSAEGTIVVVNHGDGEPRSTRAGPGGVFRFEGLAPGAWQVLAWDVDLDPAASRFSSVREAEPIEWSCEVSTGRTTRYDVDLRGE